MSGICGIVDFSGAPVDVGALNAMADIAAYRGPDGREMWVDGSVGLLHLALHVGSQKEKQPAATPDGRLRIVADARLDNRDELKGLLAEELQGSESGDGELILAAYLRWGESCLKYLLGDFAFALWDERRHQIFCARDPLGIKPLHYSHHGLFFCFASEARQVLQHRAVAWDLDRANIGQFLCGWTPSPQSTLFRHIRALAPAHRLRVTADGAVEERYWDIDLGATLFFKNAEDYSSAFLEIFRQAVLAHLRTSREKVGIAMSGGLDSCAIAAVAQELHRERGTPRVVAGSFVSDLLAECDERRYIQVMAEQCGVEREQIFVERHGILDVPDAEDGLLESPYMYLDSALVDLLGSMKQRGIDVLLTGHGGDEVVRGSRLTYSDRLLRGDLTALVDIVGESRAAGRNTLKSLGYFAIAPLLLPIAQRFGLREREDDSPPPPPWLAKGFVERVGLLEKKSGGDDRFARDDRARRAVYENVIARSAQGPNLYRYDRLCALCGFEARHPYFDRRILELVFAIPQKELHGVEIKPLLRRSMKNILPETIRKRRDKTSFQSLIDWNLRTRESTRIERLLEGSAAVELGFVDGDSLSRSFEEYREGLLRDHRFLYFFMLELWLRRYLASLHGSRGSILANVER